MSFPLTTTMLKTAWTFLLLAFFGPEFRPVQGEPQHLYLSPLPGKSSSSSGRDAAMMILPELGVSHAEYKTLGRMAQQMYPLRLWVGLVDISQDLTLSLDNLPLRLLECMYELQGAGLSMEADYFLVAHGHTVPVAADYAQAVPDTLRGLILLGNFLPRRFRLQSFPLPVLTLVGDIDGVARITRVAHTLQTVKEASEIDPLLVKHSPVVLLKGSNHDVFATSKLPFSLHAMDIEAEVDKQVAMETASNMTAMFLATVLQEPRRFVEQAMNVFMGAFQEALNLTEPIRAIRAVTQDNLRSYWVKAAQKWLSGLEGKQSKLLEVDSYVITEPGSLALPPALVKEHGINYVITFSDILRRPNHYNDDDEDGDDNGPEGGASSESPDEIAARMLGPERIQEYLKNTSIARNYTCRDLNYASFLTAYHSASPLARQRYDSYHRGVVFLPDVVTNSEALWESTRLKVERKSHALHVTSIAYRTKNDMSLSQYAGLFFCKLLPPDRALEWIYVDSLQRYML